MSGVRRHLRPTGPLAIKQSSLSSTVRPHKDHIAFGLLIVFAFGGIGAPIVHGVQHTLELEATNASHEHTHSKDGASGLATAAAPFWALTDCVLCAPLVFNVPPLVLAPDGYPFGDNNSRLQDPPLLSVGWSNSQSRAPPATV